MQTSSAPPPHLNAALDTRPVSADLAAPLLALMAARRTVLPKRLVAPGPDAEQAAQILAAAAHAPDHGAQRPWRFILIPAQARAALGDAWAQTHIAAQIEARIEAPADASAQAQIRADAHEKARRAPWLLVAVVRLYDADAAKGPQGDESGRGHGGESGGDSGDGSHGAQRRAPCIPPAERIASAGCALQNMLLMAQALGFGAALTSGSSLTSAAMRRLLDLRDGEQALCFLSVGSVASGAAGSRRSKPLRPGPDEYTSILGDGGTGFQVC